MFKLNKNILHYSEGYKYIGVILHEQMNFHKNADSVLNAEAGGRALGTMLSKNRYYKEIGISTFKKLFLNCVAPVLDYWSEILDLRNYHCIDIDQNRALRYYLGVHRFTPLPALHGESGWSLIHHRQCVNAVRYWNRLLSMDDNRITKIVFIWDMNQHNSS